MPARLDYSSALDHSIIRDTNNVYYYYDGMVSMPFSLITVLPYRLTPDTHYVYVRCQLM